MAISGLIGGLYDFVVSTFGLWTDTISTRITEWGVHVADKFKAVFSVNTSAAVLGLGYIVGLKYAAFICAGSFLVWFLIVPMVGSFEGSTVNIALIQALGITDEAILANPSLVFTPENIFAYVGKPLGIGGIAMAGIIGIIRQAGIIKQSLGMAASELKGKKGAGDTKRTDKDMPMKTILAVLIAALVCVLVFFRFGVLGNWALSAVALLW